MASRSLLSSAVVFLLVASGARGAPLPSGDLEINADPSLTPVFSRSAKDYVTRCNPDDPVDLSLNVPRPFQVRVDDTRVPRGRSGTSVEIDPGQAFEISVNARGRRTLHYVRCLPLNFFEWTSERAGPTVSQWYVMTPALGSNDPVSPYVVIFNSDGVPVWWMESPPRPIDAKLLANGNLAWSQTLAAPFNFHPEVSYEERRLDGALVRTIATTGSPTDFHDLRLLGNGNYLLLTYRARDGVDLSPWSGPDDATVLDAEIQEVTPRGMTVWSWNSKDWLTLSEGARWYGRVIGSGGTRLPDGRTGYDIVHPNSLEVLGDTIAMSARHTDAVYGISRPTGDVLWKLGGSERPESLTVTGDAVGSALGGQHDARMLPGGALTLYDNGTDRGRPPRAVRYAVDPVAGTATAVEVQTAAEVATSTCCGSARKLPGGNWVVSWTSGPLVTETTASGVRMLTLRFAGTRFSYRVDPVLPGRLTVRELRAGMDAMNPRSSTSR